MPCDVGKRRLLRKASREVDECPRKHDLIVLREIRDLRSASNEIALLNLLALDPAVDVVVDLKEKYGAEHESARPQGVTLREQRIARNTGRVTRLRKHGHARNRERQERHGEAGHSGSSFRTTLRSATVVPAA